MLLIVKELVPKQYLYLILQGPCGCILLGYLQMLPRLHLIGQSNTFTDLASKCKKIHVHIIILYPTCYTHFLVLKIQQMRKVQAGTREFKKKYKT